MMMKPQNGHNTMRHFTVFTLVLCLTLSTPEHTQAFESADAPLFASPVLLDPFYNSRNDHGRITTESLTTAEFSPSCIARIADANVGVDLAETKRLPKISELALNFLATFPIGTTV